MKIRPIGGGEPRRYNQQTSLPAELQASDLPPSYSDGFAGMFDFRGSGAEFQGHPIPNTYMGSSTQIITDQVRQILGANPRRNFLQIQNRGAIIAFLGFGVSTNSQGENGVELDPGFEIVFDFRVPNNDISAVLAAAGNATISVIEGTFIGMFNG